MRVVVSVLMFLAWLLCGAMPAVAIAPAGMAVDGAVIASADPHAAHGRAARQAAASGDDFGDPCPHCDGMPHAAFCAGCLVVLPAGPAERAIDFALVALLRAPDRPLSAIDPVPALPPPRR